MYMVINEINSNERFLNKNVILWGVWQGRGKPPTMSFLEPFVKELKEITEAGKLYITRYYQSTARVATRSMLQPK